MIKLITGAPGCGKTTKIIESLSKEYFGRKIYVAEPFQSIVSDKKTKTFNKFILFKNWSDVLSEEGIKGFKCDDELGDILVLDEFHLLYSSEYRGFKYNNIKNILQKYKNVVIITATPNEIIREINELRIECKHTHVPPRLKRDNIKINLYNTHISKFLNSVNIRDYSIFNVNNIKQLYSICKHWNVTLGSSVLVRSYFSEINNFVFSPNYIPDIRTLGSSVANTDVFIGTVALGQGIDKNSNKNEIGEERILFDANSYKVNKPQFALYEYLIQNIIQGDRYRYDTNLNIDVLYSLNPNESYDMFISELQTYIHSVYGSDIKLEITPMDFVEIPLNKIIKPYKYEDFKSCLDKYILNHKDNRKGLNERFYEILKALLDDSTDVFKRRNGAIKTAAKMAGDLFEKFVTDVNFIGDKTVRYYKVVKSLPIFIDFLKNEDLRTKFITNRINEKLPEELKKKELGLEYLSKEDLEREAIGKLGQFVEMIFIMTIKLLGYNLNFIDELKKRGVNDGYYCTKELRGLMICKDYDIKGAHVAALVKHFRPDYNIKELLDKTDIYDLSGLIEIERIANILLTFKGYKKLNYEGLLDLYKNDRGITKQTLVSCINSLYNKERRKLIEDYLRIKFNVTVTSQEWNDLELKMKRTFPNEDKVEKKVGFYNGVYHENIWLGHINNIPELFRIADGFAEIINEVNNEIKEEKEMKENKGLFSFEDELMNIFGDGGADQIKHEIEREHNIKMSNEPIMKLEGFKYKNFNDFYNEVNTEGLSEEYMRDYIKTHIKDVFYKLSEFSVYVNKGRNKGRSIDKNVNEKQYKCLKNSDINGVLYKVNEVYTFGKDFHQTVGNYNKRYFKRIK